MFAALEGLTECLIVGAERSTAERQSVRSSVCSVILLRLESFDDFIRNLNVMFVYLFMTLIETK